MNGSTDAPLVDRRLFLGLVFVIAVQGTVWFIASLMWFGVGGSAQDYVVTAFFGAILVFPLALGAFVIGLGPGVAIWVGVNAVCKLAHLSERQSAILAAPVVTIVITATCALALTFTVYQFPQINKKLVVDILAFSFPGAVAAVIYAFWAWPKTVKHEGSDK